MSTVEAPLLEPDSPERAATDPGRESRGTTTIAPAVFEKLAARAATEVFGVEGDVQTGLGRFLPWVSGTPADASAQVDDDGVELDLTFNVAYPEPVRQVAEAVRRRVSERVQSLTGCAVREVNITVAELVEPSRRPAPRVR